MSILTLAKQDWERFSQSSFDLDLVFVAPTGETVTIKGKGINNHITISTDGQDVMGRLVNISFSENVMSLANPSYPIRDSKGFVSLHQHLVSFLDSRDVLKNYKIKQVYPDSTVGMIVCDCEDYKTHPEIPTDVVLDTPTDTGFDITFTSGSNSIENGFDIEIDTDQNFTSPFVIQNDKNEITATYSGGGSGNTYWVRVKSTGDIDSNYTTPISISI